MPNQKFNYDLCTQNTSETTVEKEKEKNMNKQDALQANEKQIKESVDTSITDAMLDEVDTENGELSTNDEDDAFDEVDTENGEFSINDEDDAFDEVDTENGEFSTNDEDDAFDEVDTENGELSTNDEDDTVDEVDTTNANTNSLEENKNTNSIKSLDKTSVERLIDYVEKNDNIPFDLKLKYKLIIEIITKKQYTINDSHNDEIFRVSEYDVNEEDLMELSKILMANPNNPPSVKIVINKFFRNRQKFELILFLVKSHIRYNSKLNCYHVYINDAWQTRERMDMTQEIKSLTFYTALNYCLHDCKDYKEFIDSLKNENYVTKFLRQVPKCDNFDFQNLSLTFKSLYEECSIREELLPLFNDNYMVKLYEENATAPKWNEFLSQIFNDNKELIDYIQTVVGYCLSIPNRERACFILLGSGANGKTTFLEVLKKLFSYQAVIIDSTIFTKKGKMAEKEYKKLRDRYIAIINEMDSNSVIKGSVFKTLTGGDTIELTDKDSQTSFFKNNAKFIIACNSIPTFDENSDAIWERVKIIPFNVKFERENRNIYLLEELLSELPGILNWAIEGYRIWEKNKGLIEPQCIQEEIENARDTIDPIKDFIKVKCLQKPDETILSRDLYRAYNDWCKENSNIPIGHCKFSEMLIQRGFKTRRITKGRAFVGLQLNFK